jgi:hypothetical protein
MATDGRMELRALALWHTRRRMVDEVLAPLLEYGPIAVDRVSDRLDEVQSLVQAEMEAFAAFVLIVGEQRPAPDAIVLDLFARAGQPEAD